MAFFNMFYWCHSQGTVSIPKWLQDSWSCEFYRYHDYDKWHQSPIKCIVNVTITKSQVSGKCACRGSSTVYFKGPIVSYDGKKLYYRDQNYGLQNLLIDSHDKCPYEEATSAGNAYGIVWTYKRDSEVEKEKQSIEKEKQRKQEEYNRQEEERSRQIQEARQREEQRKQAEQQEKERLKRVIDGYNNLLDSVRLMYNNLLLDDQLNIHHEMITYNYYIPYNTAEDMIGDLFSRYSNSFEIAYSSISMKIVQDYEKEFNDNKHLFESETEFYDIYVSGNYDKTVLERKTIAINRDVQGKWRHLAPKADRNYMRLFISNGSVNMGKIKIKKATRTVYKGEYQISKGKFLLAGTFSFPVIYSEGQYQPVGFEMYNGTDDKIAWYVTKKILLYTGAVIVTVTLTPPLCVFFWSLVLS